LCKGLHPEQIADRLKLPASLAHEPNLVEYYGMLTWSIKTVFESQVGWFSGFPEDLFPLAPEKESLEWIEFLTAERMVNQARKKLDAGHCCWLFVGIRIFFSKLIFYIL
jgi:alkyl sulfatase BDS1-like metallo-beta-lactamase superfamily hydrolase